MSTDLSNPQHDADLHDDVVPDDALSDESTLDESLPDEPFDDTVEVRRDAPLLGLIGGTAAVVAIAYLLRALGSGGSPLDGALSLVVAVIAAVFLAAFADARAPLVVIDHQGVRVRRGRTWRGVAWDDVDRIEHRPRTSLLDDGSLAVVDVDEQVLAVRLSLSTRLTGSDWHELGDALLDLSEGRTTVVEPEQPVDDVEPVVPDAPEVERELAPARRQEVVLDKVHRAPLEVPADLPDAVSDKASDETEVIVLPSATSDPSTTSTIFIAADDVPETPVDPVVGPVLAAARQRVGLTVDQLAERTRIRPHVIESIELDDFGPCGGDFYARGHLRTLARILGVDVEPLLADYDERYADAPIDPRRVFEAELATTSGGAIRGTRGRLNWSVLVAAVMGVVLVWSLARLLMDAPNEVSDQPVLNGSPGGRAQLAGASTERVPVTFTAATGGARVIVRDVNQKVVFDQNVAFNQTAKVDVVPPLRISSTDGGLTVTVDGDDQGAIGSTGNAAQRTYVVR